MKLKQILVALMLLTGVVSYAHDFEYKIPDAEKTSNLYFKILDENKRTVELTYEGKIEKNLIYVSLPVELEIPGMVNYNGKSYTVVKIGKKAFANSLALRQITIPSTVKEIGNFAFEGCKYLNTIVFPTDNVKIGVGAFYQCEDIENIEFGSNWKTVDFSPFRFSKNLKEVEIPAKATEVTGLETLESLEKIFVNNRNAEFMSDKGILYSKDGKRLIFCPRNYGDTIEVKNGCEEVEEHALERCVNTSELTLPESLETISFRETYRMDDLSTIYMKNPLPIETAFEMKEGKSIGYWFFIMPNSKVTICIPKDKVEGQKPINLYKDALPPYANGEFFTPFEDNTTPYEVKAGEIPTEKNLKEYDFNNEKK